MKKQRLVQQIDELLDIHPAFRAQGDPLALFPFRRLRHYNQEGHRIVAQEVLRSISLIEI